MAELVCPYCVGYLLVCPLRKLVQNPHTILSPYIKDGDTVLDVGPAMGFFSLAMAGLVGGKGKVVCVDMQEKMLGKLLERAQKAGVAAQIETRACRQDSLCLDDLSGKADFALAFAMVHEVPDQDRLLREIAAALKPGAKFLVAEPKGHVGASAFEESMALAVKNGLAVAGHPRVWGSHTALFVKQ